MMFEKTERELSTVSTLKKEKIIKSRYIGRENEKTKANNNQYRTF
jgi:hypothetical protein